MSDIMQDITVKVMNKTLTLKAPQSKVATLQQSAQKVDEMMQHIAKNDKVVGIEKIAILAAINLAGDHIEEASQNDSYIQKLIEKIDAMCEKLNNQLAIKEN